MGNPLELYSIRAAVESDISEILDIYNERIENSTCLFMYNPVSFDNRLTWFMETKAKGYPIIVAVDKQTDKVIAYACYGSFRPHTAYILTAEISIYIHQGHQRRGLGALLLQEMLRIGKEMKLKSIIASITSENEGSILLFSKYGFTTMGVSHDVGYKFGRFLDVTFLEYIIKETKLDEGVLVPSFNRFQWDSYVYNQ